MKHIKLSAWPAIVVPMGLVLLLTIILATSRAAGQGPKMWAEKEARANSLSKVEELSWVSMRVPPVSVVKDLLRDSGRLALNAAAEETERAVQTWYQRTSKKIYFGPNPAAFKALLERESVRLNSPRAFGDDEKLETPPKNLLGVIVEFAPEGGEETITRTYPVDPADPFLGCQTQDITFGPLNLGDDPPPGPLDNFIFYKEDIGVEDYESAFFDTGPDAGYGVVRPDLGGIDLSGYSLNNYLAEMSGGTYQAGGGFLAAPMLLPHSHEYYGHVEYVEEEDGYCARDPFEDVNYVDFIFDTLDAITATYDGDDSIDWSQYDADGDQVIDLLVIIHAGYAFQNGGGEDRLSTSSSGFFDPQQVVGFDTPNDDTDDYFVLGFNVDPEQLDIGGIQEEFEHQFGLPDLYSVDENNSNAFWGAHSSGVWGGELGGARPVGHNLWQDWVLGWRDPMIVQYNDPRLLSGGLNLEIGRARYTPEGAEDGIIVRLPDNEVEVPNQAGDGVGWYSASGNMMDNRVYRSFDLSDAETPITLSFDAWWDIEEDWDYGLIEFSNDDGATWATLPDEDGILTDEDPNGTEVVIPNEVWGLTGAGVGVITFDLSAFAGDTLWIRFRYLTDPYVANPGWQIDNIVLSDDAGVLYENDLEEDFSDWTNEGWVTAPYIYTYLRYYLMEWRDDNGFDQSLNDPYWPIYSSPVEPPPEFVVDRLPATTPGLQISFRDTAEEFDYSITDNLISGPSIGAKFAHLVVDSHFMPKRFDTLFPNTDYQSGWPMSSMVGSGDALFGETLTEEWTARFDLDPITGDSSESATWPGEAPVQAFHDSYGYYPGLFYSEANEIIYYNDIGASVVLPAKGIYSTRITDAEGNLLPDLFGESKGGWPLGTGNPGDDHVHYGLHAEVVASSGPRGTVRLWTNPYEVMMWSNTAGIISTADPVKTTFAITENIGGKLEDPTIIVSLPDGVQYEEGSGFGGLMPLPSALRAQLQLDSGTFLVWDGDDIWTGAGVEPFGFEWTADEDVKSATFEVMLYRNSIELFQTESFTANEYPFGTFLPVSVR